MLLSLVVPCYNEEENVRNFYNEVTRVFDERGGFSYEFVFVNDGSKDATYKELKALNGEFSNVRVISFSRNFGKEAAIYAGLSKAVGDLVCLIDADLQQRPEVVLEMLDKMNESEDTDCVAAFQKKRKENKLLAFLKGAFYKIINKLSDVDFVSGASDFRLMKRSMVDAVLGMTEFHRFSKGIFSYVGFNTVYIPYVAEKREAGTSKWNPIKLFKYALEGIFAFSTKPLKLSTVVGFLSSFASIVYLVVVIIQKLAFGIAVPGYATIVVLLLLIGGIQLFCLGILGEYVSKIYIEAKRRPVYIQKEVLESGEMKKNEPDGTDKSSL